MCNASRQSPDASCYSGKIMAAPINDAVWESLRVVLDCADNLDKKIKVSQKDSTPLFALHSLLMDSSKNDFSDPLPLLLGYGRSKEPGEWIGDIIGVSDQRPEGYSLIKEIYVDW